VDGRCLNYRHRNNDEKQKNLADIREENTCMEKYNLQIKVQKNIEQLTKYSNNAYFRQKRIHKPKKPLSKVKSKAMHNSNVKVDMHQ
jgi:hypothetical protein